MNEPWGYRALALADHKPRQFEFHPSVKDTLLCGTIRGEVLIATEDGGVKEFRGGYANRQGDAILGLCWFNTDPSRFMSGSASGFIRCGNWQADSDPVDVADNYRSSSIVAEYTQSTQLTSVSLNCLDEKLLISGYSRDVRIDDVETTQTIHTLPAIHSNHINISRFARHSPSIFATSSFDCTAKVWDARTPMTRPIYSVTATNPLIVLSFSPDDRFLLAAAADNEVTQYLVVDGSTHMRYRIPQTSLPANYTRAYYSATGAYVFAGASEEPVVNVLSTKTGDLVARSELYADRKHSSLYIQSLRGDPSDDRQLCVLVNYRDIADRELVRVRVGMPDDQEVFASAEGGESGSQHTLLPSAQLARDLHTAYQQQQHTDTIITVHHQTFLCHAFMLVARAPVIAARLQLRATATSQWVADLSSLVPLVVLDVLPVILNFIYTDDVQLGHLRCICIDRWTAPDEEKRAAKAVAELRPIHASDPYAYDASSFEQFFAWVHSSMDEREANWRGPWALCFVELCEHLQSLATLFQLARLQSIVDDLVVKSITGHTLAAIAELAYRHGREEVMLRCQRFVAHWVGFLERPLPVALPDAFFAGAKQIYDARRALVALGEPTNTEEHRSWFVDPNAPALTKVPSFVGHAATPLLGNTVLLTGGRDHSHYHSLRCLYAYNIRTQTWARIDANGVAPPSILYHTCGALEHTNPRHVFICEGKALAFTGGRSDSSVYVLDTLTMTWQAPQIAGNGPNGRSRHSMVALHHETFVAQLDREQHSQPSAPGQEWSQTQTQTHAPPQLFSSSDFSLRPVYATPPNERHAIDVSMHTRFVLFGGYCMRDRILTNDVNVLVYHRKPLEIPNGQSHNEYASPTFHSHGFLWMQPQIEGTPPAPRLSHSAGMLWFSLERGGPRMITFGGLQANRVLNDVASLQISSLQRMRWDPIAVEGAPPAPRLGHEMALIPHRNAFLIVGGQLHESRFSDVHVLDIGATLQGITATWSEVLVDQPSASLRDYSSAIVAEETLFVFGGSVNERASSNAAEIEPHVYMLSLASLEAGRSAHWEPVRSHIYTGSFDTIFHRHIPTLHADLRRALANAVHPDVLLRAAADSWEAGSVDVPANKVVLAARCSTLQVMLDSTMIEGATGTISIQDVFPEVLKVFVEFLYTDTLHCKDEHLIHLLLLGNHYQMQRLVLLCEGFACEAIDAENCVDLLLLADSLYLRTLQLGCQGYILQHWGKFVESGMFDALPPHLRDSTLELRENPHQAYYSEATSVQEPSIEVP